MAASVQVLCPNGRRQNVKINPNTKLLQILEEVCQRQGLIPPEDYKLTHGRKELDLSLSVRFSSIPNNAKLELTRSTSARVEQDVTIALQLDSGQRLQDSFKPSTSLWDILLHFESKKSEYKSVLTRIDASQTPALYPVCIYMREEVIGESSLKAMTLKKLGMTSGKAIIRLLHRPVEESVMGEILDKLEKERQKQAKLEELALKKSEMRQLEESERSTRSDDTPTFDADKETSGSELMDADEAQVTSQATPQVLSQSTRSDTTGASSSAPSEPMEEVPDDSVSSSTTSDMSAAKKRNPRTSSKKAETPSQPQPQEQRPEPSAIEALRNLNIPGVEIITPDDFNDLSPQEQAIARRLAQRFFPALQTAAVDSPSGASASFQPQPQEPVMPFADFKFPEATQGLDLTRNSEEDTSEQTSRACDREALVFSVEEPLQSPSPESEDIPDDFFEVTQADVRALYRDLQANVHQLEEQPLMTKAMRQAQTEALFDHYEKVVIRVQFPDRLTLQGLFRPRESVSALYAFVKDHLRDNKHSFYLYTAPPKEILKDKKSSLAANRLAPAALVYFGSDTLTEKFLSGNMAVKSRLEAEAQVTRVLQPHVDTTSTTVGTYADGGSASTSQAGSSGMGRRTAPSSSSSSSSASSRLPSGAQVPKWLKLGKK